MRTAHTPRSGVQHRTREWLPPHLTRELEGGASVRLRPGAERPASIKDAIIRWLNEEL